MGKTRKLNGPILRNRRVRMLTECQVGEILSRHQRGEGKRTIAKAMSISERTVKRYLKLPEEKAQQALCRQSLNRHSQLDSNYDRIVQLFWETEGNCPNILEILASDGIIVPLRTLQWFCNHHGLRRQQHEILNSKRHSRRIETNPGEEIQIDFGEKDVLINGITQRVHFFVATLGYSRRIYAKFFPIENKEAWYSGLESSFYYFGGIPRKVICDNAKALVYQAVQREKSIKYNESFINLCKYWGIRPQACTPHTPQQKGKVERSVSYIQNNFLKDFRNFRSYEDMQQKFSIWNEAISDKRNMKTSDGIHFTPESRFKSEVDSLQPIYKSKISEYILEERKSNDNCLIIVNYKQYLVPEELRNRTVQLQIGRDEIIVSYNGKTYARIDKKDYQIPILRYVSHENIIKNIGQEFPDGMLDRSLDEYDKVVS